MIRKEGKMGQELTRAQADERAERGAERLDRADPNWAIGISVTDVVMEYMDRCVLGKVYGHYRIGVLRLGLPDLGDLENDGLSLEHPLVTHGFDLSVVETYDENGFDTSQYRVLTDAWRHQIHLRQVRGVVPITAAVA